VPAARIQARPDLQPEQRRRRRGPAAWIIGSILVLALAGIVFKPPVAVLAPGASFDVTSDIHISGMNTDHVHGRYLLTSVEVDQPTGFGLLWALAKSREVVPISAILPRGVDAKKYISEQKKMFEQSEMIAAGAAARAAGMHVELTGKGVRVVDIVPGAPAYKVLRKGDAITSIDGVPVFVAEDVGRIVRARPAGTEFTFSVDRSGQPVSLKVRSRAGVVQEGPAIGIFTETKDLSIHLPFKVTFASRDIGGTSAGLAYALATYDLITHGDLARGRAIAATGTIDLDGHVGPIGGVREKGAAAKSAGARLFLVPDEELPDAHGPGLETHGVGTLQDAIRTLERA
jgi:PDZ domain-containing protein